MHQTQTPVSSKNGSADVAAPVVSQAAIQVGADRVFVTHPRLFSFSHRGLTSIRHPYLPFAVSHAAAEVGRAKRQWQTKHERLCDMLTPSSPAMKTEEERWRNVAYMLDSVMFEHDLSARRTAAIELPTVRRALETLWCQAGGTTTSGVGLTAYERLHSYAYEKLVGTTDALRPIFAQAIEADFELDRDGTSAVPFGRFYIGLLEIADNWLTSCDGDAYAAFLQDLVAALALPCVSDEPKSRGVEASPWSEITGTIEHAAAAAPRSVLVRATKNAANQTVYEQAVHRE